MVKSSRFGRLLSTLSMLAAQGLNFVAMLVPVLFGRLHEVAFLVIVGAIALISALTFSFAFPSVYPGLAQRSARVESVVAATTGLLVASVLFVAAAVVGFITGAEWSLIILLSAMLMLAQGAYLITTSILVQQNDLPRFALTRSVYAISNLLGTIAALAFFSVEYSLAVSAIVCFSVASVIAVFGRLRRGTLAVLAVFPSLRQLLNYVRSNWAATTSGLFAGLAFQSSSLATGFLGGYAGLWASVVRVSGGFASTAQQVVAPIFEMQLSAAIRENRRGEVRRMIVRSTLLASGLSLLAYVAIVATLMVGGALSPAVIGDAERSLVLAVIFAYTIGAVLPSISSKFMVMGGRQRTYFLWVACKLLVTAVTLILLRGLEMLVALSIIELLSAIAYVAILAMGHPKPKQ